MPSTCFANYDSKYNPSKLNYLYVYVNTGKLNAQKKM